MRIRRRIKRANHRAKLRAKRVIANALCTYLARKRGIETEPHHGDFGHRADATAPLKSMGSAWCNSWAEHPDPLCPPAGPFPSWNGIDDLRHYASPDEFNWARQEAEYNLLYKTTDCKSWTAQWGCRYGAKCRFRHPHEPVWPRPTDEQLLLAMWEIIMRNRSLSWGWGGQHCAGGEC